MSDLVQLSINLGGPAAFVLLGLVAGTAIEARHYRSIRRREKELADVLIFSLRRLPEEFHCHDAVLVEGSVVVSTDPFKRLLGTFRALIGGKIHAYETLLDRARREAILRMKQTAAGDGRTMIFNVRFETARISAGTGRFVLCVEALAYGTAVRTSGAAAA